MASRHHLGTGLVAAFCLSLALPATGQDGPPHRRDWAWPIFEPTGNLTADDLIETALARPAIWTTNGEYQNFGDARFSGVDPHPGIDIRAQAGDVALFPQAGQLIEIQNLANCEDASGGDKCRIFVRTDDGLVYYVAHFSYGGAPDGSMVRSYAQTFHNAFSGQGAARVEKGQQAGVTRAYASPKDWDHMHVSIFDPARAYDSLDPLEFLERQPVSMTGAMLDIIDDERPQVGEIEFVAQSGTVDPTGFCGVELTGSVDIAVDLRDTFYTRRPQPNPFPGRDDWNDTVGVKGARYLVRPIAAASASRSAQWYESPVGCSGTGCGMWRLRFPSADRNAGLVAANDDTLFVSYLNDFAPVAMAGEVGPSLWDPSRSTHDHVGSGAFSFIHWLTNGVTENSVAGADGAWDTASGDDGRYVVTVEAWDFDGNLAARSVPVTVNNDGGASTGTGSSWGQVYVKDHGDDIGQIPSTVGGEPFWASPDIIVVPKDTAVTPDTFASSFPLVVDQEYDVYVRAHNHGCTPVSGVQAAVYTATPGTTFSNVRAISPAGGWAGTAKTVPAGGRELIGPFRWTVTAADLDGGNEGHRCFLAAIHSASDPGPGVADPAQWDVINEDNVAQRNIQTTELRFAIKNVNPAVGASKLVVELENFPSEGTFALLVEEADQLDAAWSYPVENGKYVIDVANERHETPVWTMPGITELDSEVRFSLPAGVNQRKVTVTHVLDNATVGGMVFFLSGPPIVK